MPSQKTREVVVRIPPDDRRLLRMEVEKVFIAGRFRPLARRKVFGDMTLLWSCKEDDRTFHQSYKNGGLGVRALLCVPIGMCPNCYLSLNYVGPRPVKVISDPEGGER